MQYYNSMTQLIAQASVIVRPRNIHFGENLSSSCPLTWPKLKPKGCDELNPASVRPDPFNKYPTCPVMHPRG